MADLIFSQAPYTGGPVDLVFGATSEPPVAESVTMSVRIGSAWVGGVLTRRDGEVWQPAPRAALLRREGDSWVQAQS